MHPTSEGIPDNREMVLPQNLPHGRLAGAGIRVSVTGQHVNYSLSHFLLPLLLPHLLDETTAN